MPSQPAPLPQYPLASSTSSPVAVLVLAWVAVSLPLLWGVLATLKKALALFA